MPQKTGKLETVKIRGIRIAAVRHSSKVEAPVRFWYPAQNIDKIMNKHISISQNILEEKHKLQ